MLPTLEERFKYLSIRKRIGESTFGYERYLNQSLYRTKEWKNLRSHIIVRDGGNDLAMEGYPVYARGAIHHINPLTIEDILEGSDAIFDPENLVLCSFQTHNAIHFGDSSLLPQNPIERRPNDTCPWKQTL